MKSRVYLLDGRILTIDELRQEHEEGKQNWTYSVDQPTGTLIPGLIDWAGYTRKDADMVRVHLDNGESIDCTPDHKFVLKNGSEVEAQFLTPDMSLMSIYKKYAKTNKTQNQEKYERIIDNATGKWTFTHLTINPKLGECGQTVIHHKDHNASNNNPTNLVDLSHDDHCEYALTNHGEFESFQDVESNYGFNHKILSVELLPDKEDTGCLHVVDPKGNHNFALAVGVYVKNSRPDGRGSRVEALPGGAGLGNLEDLEYFQGKVFRGLRIPLSFMQDGQNNSILNDGKTGIAYIQELRFAMYIKRLQNYIGKVMDTEFKRYLRMCGIQIDPTIFSIKLPEPENFGIYRQQQLNGDLLNTYSQADGVGHFAKRFTMSKYLQLSQEDILLNQRMKAEELGLDPDNLTKADLQQIYNPTPEGDMGMGGGMGGGLGGGMSAGTLGGGLGDMGLGDDTGLGGDMGLDGDTSGTIEPPTIP
jgi:hypothetical protein